MIVFVTGAIGSGKTYAATKLTGRVSADFVSLDAIFFDSCSAIHRERRDLSERDAQLCLSLKRDHVVFEGWHFGDWLIPMYKRLGLLLIIDAPLALREERIRSRFERRKAGREEDPFPLGGEDHLQNLLKWTRLFDPEETVAEIGKYVSAQCRIVYSNSDLDGLDMEGIQQTDGAVTQESAPSAAP